MVFDHPPEPSKPTGQMLHDARVADGQPGAYQATILLFPTGRSPGAHAGKGISGKTRPSEEMSDDIILCMRCRWFVAPETSLAECSQPDVMAARPGPLPPLTMWARKLGPCGPAGLKFWAAKRRHEIVWPWSYAWAQLPAAGPISQALAVIL